VPRKEAAKRTAEGASAAARRNGRSDPGLGVAPPRSRVPNRRLPRGSALPAGPRPSPVGAAGKPSAAGVSRSPDRSLFRDSSSLREVWPRGEADRRAGGGETFGIGRQRRGGRAGGPPPRGPAVWGGRGSAPPPPGEK